MTTISTYVGQSYGFALSTNSQVQRSTLIRVIRLRYKRQPYHNHFDSEGPEIEQQQTGAQLHNNYPPLYMLTKHYLNLIALTRQGQTLSTLDGNTGVVSDRLQSSGRAGKESKVVSSNPSVQYSG